MLFVLLAQAASEVPVQLDRTGWWFGAAGIASAVLIGVRQLYVDLIKSRSEASLAAKRADLDENDRRFEQLQKEQQEVAKRYTDLDAQRVKEIDKLESEVTELRRSKDAEIAELRKAEAECGRKQERQQAQIEGLIGRLDLMEKLGEENKRLIAELATAKVRLEHAEKEVLLLRADLHAVRNEKSAEPILIDPKLAEQK